MNPSIPILRSQIARDNPGQTQGELVETCTILTTEANELMRPIHDRMPVILDPAGEDAWLDSRSSPDGLRALLVPFASDRMEAFPVNPYVSNAKNEGPRCIAPAGALFNGGHPIRTALRQPHFFAVSIPTASACNIARYHASTYQEIHENPEFLGFLIAHYISCP
jgi:hypothetical protein